MTIQELRDIIRRKTLNRECTSLLKYVLAESERYGRQPVAVMEKLIEDNKKSYEISNDQRFVIENEELKQYLPEYISLEEVAELISGLSLDDSGKSVGIAIKHLKSLNVSFRNDDVKNAIKHNNSLSKP
jgi:uncharacterized protein YeeX (DUF496 family)